MNANTRRMVHPAVLQEFDASDALLHGGGGAADGGFMGSDALMAGASSARPPLDPQAMKNAVDQDLAQEMRTHERNEMRRQRIAATPDYQRKGRAGLRGYLNNPFDERGRAAIGQQFWEAPMGGYTRRALEGQEVFGHTITGGQARVAEQALAGLTAVGVGVPAFMAALNNLTTPQSQGTIPM